MAFEAAKCPNCGANIQVPSDRDVAKCMYCGKDIVVREAIRAGGIDVENVLKMAQTAEEAGNTEDANRYWSRLLEHDTSSVEAWLGKAKAVDMRIINMIRAYAEAETYCRKAIQAAGDGTRSDETEKEVGKILRRYLSQMGDAATKHYMEFWEVEDAAAEYLARAGEILEAYDRRIASGDKMIARQSAVNFCDQVLQTNLGYITRGTSILDPIREARGRYIRELQELCPQVGDVVAGASAERERKVEVAIAASKGRYSLLTTLVVVPSVLVIVGIVGILVWSVNESSKRKSGTEDPPNPPTTRASAIPLTEAPAPSSHCGDPAHPVRGRALPADWSSWSCQSATVAGKRWPTCVARLAYTDVAGMGCGGETRCCPPEGKPEAKPEENPPKPTTANDNPACHPCSTQEDFDVAWQKKMKCCPVRGCEGDSDCLGSRVCCRIPMGTLCTDPKRCGGSDRVP